jgi:extracellular factor (EF) 3-hydroxypalmitic acid methyl ester biosynthesis protein
LAESARAAGRPFRVLNVGCGPAYEIQRFLQTYPDPDLLSFELVDFNEETLTWVHGELDAILSRVGKPVSIDYVQDSVHGLLKRRLNQEVVEQPFDAVYCAGLFDYLSDKVCTRLLAHFASRIRSGGTLLVTNVHPNNPERIFAMEHLAEWYLIYRDEAKMNALLPERSTHRKIYTDDTGVNVFAEVTIP